MRFAIYSRAVRKDEKTKILSELVDYLIENDHEVALHENLKSYYSNAHEVSYFDTVFDLEDKAHFVLSLGGDGTILDTLSIVKDSGIPVFGINIGRLGFLASTAHEMYKEALDGLVKGRYSISHRSVLQLEASEDLFEYPFALNDFVIHKTETSSMITVSAYLNGEFLNAYWADGLIIASPTGSSGYSLSCGGPILFPGSSSVAITPIAPHNLNVRPIVISDQNVLSFKVSGRSHRFLVSMDSRSVSISPNTDLAIKRADFTFNVVRLENQTFHTTLRNKMMWGVDNRNL